MHLQSLQSFFSKKYHVGKRRFMDWSALLSSQNDFFVDYDVAFISVVRTRTSDSKRRRVFMSKSFTTTDHIITPVRFRDIDRQHIAIGIPSFLKQKDREIHCLH
jgi:hypothetical protein